MAVLLEIYFNISNLNRRITDILMIDVIVHDKEIEKEITNIYINTFLTKSKRNALVYYNPCF